MIRMTGKLKQFVEMSENRSRLAWALEIDETLLSRLISGERSASAQIIEKFYNHTAISLSESWEIVEG